VHAGAPRRSYRVGVDRHRQEQIDAVVEAVREGLIAVADPARAPGQQAYMKSAMPFLGVRVPDARRVATTAIRGLSDGEVLLGITATLWDQATHREHRYAALAVLAARPLRGDDRLVPLIEHVVRTGRWWDFTDEVAHRVSQLHDADPATTAHLVREWSTDDDFWMRRLAIISQLGRRGRTDRDLLAELIEPNLADSEFFIRKAIGWALRAYAYTDPDWVRAFATTRSLSALSRREAMKHL